jgi:glycosyltransferase involved in cell wall biosynthesis
MSKLCSIIIRTKNEERWISSCLRSVFRQSYKNIEVIIVDNKSTDLTVERSNYLHRKRFGSFYSKIG